MYKRVPIAGNGRRRKKRGRKWKRGRWIRQCVIPMIGGILGIFLLMVMKAIAAPEDPVIEALAAQEIKDQEGEEIESEPVYGEYKKEPGVPVIVVDPGHGGMDGGCCREDAVEKEINLQIGERLRNKLEEKGYQVIMAREGDTYVAKEERVEMANHYQADLYISIHQNAYEGTDVNGIETWYCGEDASRDSRRLAELIHRETVKSTGACGRELKSDSEFYVTNHTLMPACLIETGFLSNKKEREQLAAPEYQERIADGIAKGIELYLNPKSMYLTFDDGPSAENTNIVLDLLKARDIKATFFVIGESVRKNPEVTRRIVEEGHTIGIHCNNHDYHDLYQSVDSYLQDFDEALHAVREVTGVSPWLYRFPGGSINAYNEKVREGIIEEMNARGYVYYDWNASLEDAICQPDPEVLIENARETTLGRRKIILLAHDVVDCTVSCLEEILDQFPEYRMEALTPEVDPIQF